MVKNRRANEVFFFVIINSTRNARQVHNFGHAKMSQSKIHLYVLHLNSVKFRKKMQLDFTSNMWRSLTKFQLPKRHRTRSNEGRIKYKKQ